MKIRRKKKRAPKPALTERESMLCDEFAEAARGDGWDVYPEVSNWDLVLVWNGTKPLPNYVRDRFEPGTQVGVQAKLKANFGVVYQAMEGRYGRSSGPHYRAVLVPKSNPDFLSVCQALGIQVFDEEHIRETTKKSRYGYTTKVPRSQIWPFLGGRSRASQPLWLPPVIPDRSGGVPGPSALTRWRLAAIRVCLRLEEKGFVTSADFNEFGISPQLWVDRWITNTGRKVGRLAVYESIPGAKLPIEGWRDVALQLVNDAPQDTTPSQA